MAIGRKGRKLVRAAAGKAAPKKAVKATKKGNFGAKVRRMVAKAPAKKPRSPRVVKRGNRAKARGVRRK